MEVAPGMPQSPAAAPSADDRLATRAMWSLILGLISVFGLFIPLTLPAGVVGLILGIRSLSSSRRGWAIAGVVLSSVGLVLILVVGVLLFSIVQQMGLERAIEFMTH